MSTSAGFFFIFKAWQRAKSWLRNCCHNTEEKKTSNIGRLFVSSSLRQRLCWVWPVFDCFILVLVLILNAQSAKALEKISVDLEEINTKDWRLEGVSLSLFELNNKTPQLVLSIKQLSLPEPFSDISLFNIQCLSFEWQDNIITCKKGKARIKSKLIKSLPFAFSFYISEKQNRFSLQNLKFAKGTLSFKAKEIGKKWNIVLKSKGLQLPSFKPYLSEYETGVDEISKGQMGAEIEMAGNDKGLNRLLLKSLYANLSLQANQGQIITESLSFGIDLNAKLNNGIWQWEMHKQINQGELFIEPIYLEIDKALSLNANGLWNEQGDIKIHQANFNHTGILEIKAEGNIKNKPEFSIDAAHVSINIEDLEQFEVPYIIPFVEQTALEGIKLQGRLNSEIDIKQSVVEQLSVNFSDLMVNDHKKRFEIESAQGRINWSLDPGFLTPSYISWHQLKVKAVPIDAGKIKFLGKNKNFELLEPSAITLLGGVMEIKQFSWQKNTDDEPQVFFEGGINNVSLEQLSHALDWTPLSGNISGHIPGVEYKNKTLTVNGGLKVKVFDGTIKINKLASSGLFSDFSRFNMDMEIDNLDLHAITQKFEMGEMQGRVSGFVNNLYLENWEPVTFYAWIGTPEDDDSKHRISQKAVENIASIGGGGAANVLSRSFLRFFDTFGYDRLGFGCYLHQGVCQLMGVEAAEQGYYIVKGGGLPRINVMGFNPQIDFKVLMKRLSRIATTDKVEIK